MRKLSDFIRGLLGARAYRRLVRVGAVLGAIASIYAFLTLELFTSLIFPESGRLSPTFRIDRAATTVDFGFLNLTDTPINDLTVTFGTYSAEGALIHPDYFTPKGMTVDARGEKIASAPLTAISGGAGASGFFYLFCADFKSTAPFARVREVYVLVPVRQDLLMEWAKPSMNGKSGA